MDTTLERVITYLPLKRRNKKEIYEAQLFKLIQESKKLYLKIRASTLPEVPDLEWKVIGELKETSSNLSDGEIFQSLREEAENCICYQEGITLYAYIEWPPHLLILLAAHLERELEVPVEGYNNNLYVRVNLH